ncbi:MAG: STAS domain-containing protein [SAR324 cluster bacterium]|nr:STAS domain-containing protein [SAR324 cluster bacterium]
MKHEIIHPDCTGFMELTPRIVNNICIISLESQLTKYEVGDFLSSIYPLLDDSKVQGVLINLENVDYINSPGVGGIILIYKYLKRYEKLMKLCNLSEDARDVFETNGLHKIIEIYDTEEDALASFLANYGIL